MAPGQPPRSRRRRWLASVLAFGVALAFPASAAADDGLHESSTSRYVVSEKAVQARITVTLRNTIPDRRANGRIEYYYFNSYQIPVPASVKKVTATSDGTTLNTTLGPGPDETMKYAKATFPPLRYGRTRSITYRFDIPGAGFRSKDYTRVGDGFAAFVVQGAGEPGEVSVEVVLPLGMEFNSTADGFTATNSDDTVVWRADRHTDATGIWSFISARDPARVGRHVVTIGEDTVALLSFPGDDEWAEFISAQVAQGVPVLESLIGLEWPGGLDTIREDVAPAVTGYAWFDLTKREIVLGEEFDAALLFHELTHAWLNSHRINGRWLYEGLTEVVAQRAVERTGEASTPRQPPNRKSKVGFPLVEWEEGAKVRADAAEHYGYDAAYTAVNELVGDLDDATLAQLITAVHRRESAYHPAEQDRPSPLGRVEWRRFLDLLEDRAGVTGADEVYRTWVLTEGQADQLQVRAATREAYRRLDAADGAWLPPQGLRAAMDGWRFRNATAMIDALQAVAEIAGDLQQATTAAGLDEPDWLRQAWQDADTDAAYAELATVLPRMLDLTGLVREASEAVAAADDPASRIGKLLLSVEPTVAGARHYLATGELDAADTWARTALDRSRMAVWVGLAAIAAVALALAGAIVIVITVRRARRRRHSGAHTPGWPAPDTGPRPPDAAGTSGPPGPPGTVPDGPHPAPPPPPRSLADTAVGPPGTVPDGPHPPPPPADAAGLPDAPPTGSG